MGRLHGHADGYGRPYDHERDELEDAGFFDEDRPVPLPPWPAWPPHASPGGRLLPPLHHPVSERAEPPTRAERLATGPAGLIIIGVIVLAFTGLAALVASVFARLLGAG